MSASISSATSQPQFIQMQQNTGKTDATNKGDASTNANVESAQTPPVQTGKQAVA